MAQREVIESRPIKQDAPSELSRYDYLDIMQVSGEEENVYFVRKEGKRRRRLEIDLAKLAIREFTSEPEPEAESPEVAQLQQRIAQLEGKIEDFEQKSDKRHDETSARLDNLTGIIETLVRRLDDHGIKTTDIRQKLGEPAQAIENGQNGEKDEPSDPFAELTRRNQELEDKNKALEDRIVELEKKSGDAAPAQAPSEQAQQTETGDTTKPAVAETTPQPKVTVAGFTRGDKVRVNNGQEVQGVGEVKMFFKDGDTDLAVIRDESGNHFVARVDRLVKVVEPAPAEAVAETTSGNTATETTEVKANTAALPSRSEVRIDQPWYKRAWWNLRNEPSPRYYVNEETGTWYRRRGDEEVVVSQAEARDSRGIVGSAAAIGALILLGLGIYTAHEVEEIEHRQSNPQAIKKIETAPGEVGTIVIGGKTVKIATLNREALQRLKKIYAYEQRANHSDARRDRKIYQALIRRINRLDQKMTRQHIHDHGHEMLAIHGNEFSNGRPNSYFHPNEGK